MTRRTINRISGAFLPNGEWNHLRRSGGAAAAKTLKGLRFVLLRHWENLTGARRATIRALDSSNRRLLRGWQLKEELRDIFTLPLLAARRALDDWLSMAVLLDSAIPFVRRHSIVASIDGPVAADGAGQLDEWWQLRAGVHDPHAFITMIMLDRAGIVPRLPWTTFA